MQVSTIGLDIAKNVFQVHGEDAEGRIAFQRKLGRNRMVDFFAKIAPCVGKPVQQRGGHDVVVERGDQHVRQAVARRGGQRVERPVPFGAGQEAAFELLAGRRAVAGDRAIQAGLEGAAQRDWHAAEKIEPPQVGERRKDFPLLRFRRGERHSG